MLYFNLCVCFLVGGGLNVCDILVYVYQHTMLAKFYGQRGHEISKFPKSQDFPNVFASFFHSDEVCLVFTNTRCKQVSLAKVS